MFDHQSNIQKFSTEQLYLFLRKAFCSQIVKMATQVEPSVDDTPSVGLSDDVMIGHYVLVTIGIKNSAIKK